MKPATSILITATALTSSLAFAQLTTQDVTSDTQKDERETKMHHLIKNPKTPVDFVRNIKYAFDNNLFLDDLFFEKKNICETFGIEEQSCTPREVNLEDGTRGMTLIENVALSSENQDSMQFKSSQRQPSASEKRNSTANILVNKRIDTQGIVSGGINATIFEGGPNFAETVKILNVKLSRIIEMPPHGKISLPITGAHGDETWKHDTSDVSFRKNLRIGFHEDGTLESILVEIDGI